MQTTKRIALLTSGGDAPGMNAAVRAATRAALARGWEMHGVRNGYAGLMNDTIEPLQARDVGGIIQRGGTVLGSARSPEFATDAGRAVALANLRRRGIDALIVIGGNGTQTGASVLAHAGFAVVGVASTVDNDLAGTDVTIGVDTAVNITVEAIDELIKQGKLNATSRKDIGRSELGIGIRKGAPRPDISTVAAFKKALLDAKSITYPQDGASRGYLEKMFERLGIASQVKPKIILAPGSGPAAESVATGKAAMVMTLFSEIVPNKGDEILGPLPGEYQSDIRFAAAASSSTKNADAVKALLAFMTGPKAAPILKSKGIEPK